MMKNRQKFLGWFLPSLAAMLIWGVWGFLPKIVLQSLPPQDIVFYEAAGNMIIAAFLYFIILKRRVEKNRRGIAFAGLTSVLTVISILAYFQALRLGPVSVISPLTALYPAISILLAWVFLGERINRLQMMAVVLAMVSIVLLAG